MKVSVRDEEILKVIEPQELSKYLKSHGWHEDRPFLDNATVWLKQENNCEEYEILLPNQQSLGDYTLRISEALETLEEVENRSQIAILSELITNLPSFQVQGLVTYIKTPNPDRLSGEIILSGVIFDKLCKIQIELVEHDYILAIKAFQERSSITVAGDLIKENHIYYLKNPHNLKLDNL